MKRSQSCNQGKKSTAPKKPEGTRHRFTREELLNADANPTLFRTQGQSSTDDDSDVTPVSRRESQIDPRQLPVEEQLRLLRILHKELNIKVADENTPVKNKQHVRRAVAEESEPESEGSGDDSESNSEKEEDMGGMDHDDEEMTELERQELIAKIPVLARLSNDALLQVCEIIRNDDFTIEKKPDLLEDFLNSKALKECVEYLHEEQCDFLKYGTQTGRNLAEAAIRRGKYNHLQKIIANWKDGEKAKMALGFWLERHGQKEVKKENLKKPEKNDEKPGKKGKKKEKKVERSKSKRWEDGVPEQVPAPKMADKKDEEKLEYRTRDHYDSASHRRIYSDLEGIPFTKEIYDKCPKVMNIVIMGPTGVGKSSLINNIMNLLAFKDLDDADSAGIDGIKVLIPTYFRHNTAEVDEKTGAHKYVPIYMEPNIQPEQLGDTENEVHRTGESATQSPKSYLFSWGPADNNKYIRLIDTPGVADSSGALKDKMNFDNILDFISGFQEIHAICILMRANETRSTVISRYCLKELLGHLHSSATKNIFFCFTNSRGYDYSPGDSYTLMLEELKKLKYPVQFDGKYFCFDSESFRYLCCRQNDITFSEDVANNYRRSFAHSKQELFKMIEAITKEEPHKVGQTLDVNNVRRLIMALLRPIAEMSKAALRTTRMFEEEIEELEEFEERGIDIQQKMKIKVPKLVTKPLPFPKTVCASTRCTERKTIDGIDQNHYKTVCHDHCRLHGVPTKIINNPALQKCVALSKDITNCRVCHCSWEFHIHITYTLETVMEDAIDSIMQEELNRITDKKQQAERMIACYTKRIDDLNEEKEKILVFLVDGLAYLTEHSIVPINDAFVEYLDHMIEQGGNDDLRQQLVEYRDQYKELILQQSHIKNHQAKTTEEMYAMIQQLKGMAENGHLFREVQKLELLQLKNEPSNTEKPLDLNRNWLGYFFHKMTKQHK